MPSEASMKAVLQAYLDNFNAGNLDGLTGLFADDAIVEDPVGAPAHNGKAEIRAFYEDAMKNGAILSLSAPIRGSHGNAAAMAFEAKVGPLTIRIVDVMTFNAAGKITSMKAYFGPEDFIQV
ncbi:MAG: steroid delta-isomerase [Rhodospirillales bacterium]|nr:steroid delta-isomerase [Rhodospirillales bacterium]